MKASLILALITLAAPNMAWSQTTSQAQEDKSEQRTDATTLDTVTVTVQRRTEHDTQVPRSMTVQNQTQLQQAQALSVTDLAALGPNMSSSQANGINTLTLRGIGGGGRNIGFDPRVGVYVDGVYAGQVANLAQSLYGVEQAVVLRGPQGSLFGRNSVAGAVLLSTQEPSDEGRAEIKLGAGNKDLRQFEATVSGPLGGAVRGVIGGRMEQRDGTSLNGLNGDQLDDHNRHTVRGQLAIDAGERDQVKLFFDQSQLNEHNMVGIAQTSFFSVPVSNPSSNFSTTPELDVRLHGMSAHWIHQQGDHEWTVIAGHRTTKQQRINDTDYSAFDLVRVNYEDQYRVNSLEARIANSDQARSRYVLGVYGARETADTMRRVDIGTDLMTPITVPGMPVQLPFGLVYGLRSGVGAVSDGTVTTNGLALFGQWDYDISERWTTHVGGRVGRETKDVVYNLDGRNSGKMGIAVLNGFDDRRSRTDVSPTVGVSFHVTDEHTAYATYSQGFKSGGWNLDFLNQAQVNSGFSFDDETVDNWELGIKGQGQRWAYDAVVFQANIDDFQVHQFVPFNGGSVLALRNAASARSRGVELQGRWLASSMLSLNGSLGYLDASFRDFPGGGAGGSNLRGNDLPEAPHATASIGAQLRWAGWDGTWNMDGQAAYRSDSYAGVDNLERQILDARTVVNAQLGYAHHSGTWGARLWARNLTNSQADVYRTRDFFGHDVSKAMEPREVGVELSLYF